MSLALRLGAAAAFLLSACGLDVSGKLGCNTGADCVPGYLCVANRCVPSSGGGTAGGGSGGNMSVVDGGPGDGAPPGMCSTAAVTTCPPADAGPRCEETFCGGRLWQNGVMPSLLVPYRIADDGMFSSSYRNAIRAGAAAWTRATAGFLTFRECMPCSGRFISVVPGDGDGITNPDGSEQFLPMPVGGNGSRVSPHWIAHQWGHVAGLAHTYARADRDRYLRFDPELWCAPGGSGVPPRCASGPPGAAGLPAVTTGTFGAFDGKSKMNGFRSEGICGADEPDEDSLEPTLGDVSALAELFFGAASSWSPFRPIGRSLSPDAPLDYQLAPGVDPVGAPAIAEVAYASPEIFVRGTDNRIYTTTRREPLTSATAEWSEWSPVANDVDADPAVVFAVNAITADPERLFLAVRSQQDGNIHLRSRRAGEWGAWTSLGAPPAGAASAPALASESPFNLAVVVRGGDGLIHWLPCTDATQDCVTSAARPDAWKALPQPSPGIFVGKPSAVWLRDKTGLTIAAVRDDRVALVLTGVNDSLGDWLPLEPINDHLAPDDPHPGVAIALTWTPGDLTVLARNQQGLLVSATLHVKFFPIGGLLASPPSAVAISHQASVRTDVAAIIDDHGRPGVWWRYSDGNYVPPCHYNRPGTCGECGL